MAAKSFRGLTAYEKAFVLAMEIYQLSKTFPNEERYGLTSQIRRSSRSVCSSIGEAYRKRQYPAYFISKSSDADSENTETQVWLDFALACGYVTQDVWNELQAKADEVGRLVNHMIENPNKYQSKAQRSAKVEQQQNDKNH